MKFIIDRNKWLRGMGEGFLLANSYDALHYGKPIKKEQRCCIGFVAKQCGVADKFLKSVGTVALLPFKVRPDILVKGKEKTEKKWLQHAYAINDSQTISGEVREKKLKAIAQRAGHEFKFIN